MVVLDASIILKWLIAEEGYDAALQFRDRHIRGEEHIVVPSLLFYEVANVLRYKEDVPDNEIVALFDILNDLELSSMHPAFLELEEIILYAREKKISVYDASYAVLARRLGCLFITADARLAHAVKESFVKCLE